MVWAAGPEMEVGRLDPQVRSGDLLCSEWGSQENGAPTPTCILHAVEAPKCSST